MLCMRNASEKSSYDLTIQNKKSSVLVQEACVTTTQNKQSRLNSFVPNGTVTDAQIMLALEIVLKKYFLNSCTYKNIFQLISYTLISLIFFIMLNKLSNNWLQWSKHIYCKIILILIGH